MPMISGILRVFNEHKSALIISAILFILPFFWLNPGQMDLGGDANRLYFYDPVSFFKSYALYGIAEEGRGIVEPRYFYFPYVLLIAFLKSIVQSGTYVIAIFNGLKLAGGFIAVYLIVKELLGGYKEVNKSFINKASIISGIFYVVSFSSFHMAFFWDRALFTHDQIFLNPIIFYLLLKFFLTEKYNYLWIAIFISFVFATNFSLLGSAPPFFAFYPLATLFLLLYVIFFRRKRISLRGLIVGVLFFLGVHFFHYLPEVFSFFDKGSAANTLTFTKKSIEAEGAGYFTAVHQHGQALINLLLPSSNKYFMWTSILSPLIIILGFLLSKKNKVFLLIASFFCITFFLATANITNLGYEFYRLLFYIPGFAMFRNFYTQWMYVYIFFYSILLGFSIYYLFRKLKSKYLKIFYVSIFSIFILTGIPLFLGWPVNKATIRASNNISSVTRMDPKYEQTLNFIRALPDDGKIMVLPLTDFFRQVIYGKDGGAYEGPSTLLALTDKYSFVGYQHFGYKNGEPYAEDIMKYSREKNYDRLIRIFSVLNIRYILHNTDPKAYEENFFPGSFGYMMTSLPKTQEGYKEFLTHFPLHVIYKNDPYIIYEIDKSFYNPTIFIPKGAYESSKLSFEKDKINSIFIDRNTCGKEELANLCKEEYRAPNIDANFKMVNPALYSVSMRQNEPVDKILLVMQHTYHRGWKLIIGGKEIPESSHILVNGYANGWVIDSKYLPDKDSYTMLIKLDPQKYFWYGWSITLLTLSIIMAAITISIFNNYAKK